MDITEACNQETTITPGSVDWRTIYRVQKRIEAEYYSQRTQQFDYDSHTVLSVYYRTDCSWVGFIRFDSGTPNIYFISNQHRGRMAELLPEAEDQFSFQFPKEYYPDLSLPLPAPYHYDYQQIVSRVMPPEEVRRLYEGPMAPMEEGEYVEHL